MYVYKDGMSLEEQKDGAYWERNMLALLCCHLAQQKDEASMPQWERDQARMFPRSGWYYDTDNNWDGWKRVISIDGGRYCFHIPDDFDVGNLPQIAPNWDGHTTEEKWLRVAALCGVVRL